MTAADAFLRARDFLLAHRTDYATAYRDFKWPELTEFNWALDHFDRMAAGNDRPALWIVEESGEERKLSFAQMSARSNQVANWLRAQGARRGDRVLLMLNNEVPLWESMLACIKLGVVLIPCSNLLTPQDLRDRMLRGDVKHAIVGAANVEKFADVPGSYTRVCVGKAVSGWLDFADSIQAPAGFSPDGATRASDPLLLYFTSGTTSQPKLVLHTHQSYPVGHLSTMYWIGLQPGDIHLNISSPGWAKHAWSCFFAPWNAGACVFIYNYTRFNAPALLGVLEKFQVTTMCAPPTVWRMLIQEDLAAHRDRLHIRELIGAGEPLNPEVIEQIKTAWGITVRDGYGQTETTAQVGNPPGQPVKAGSMGRPLPGYRVVLIDADGQQADEGELALHLDPRPVGLMSGYLDDSEKNAEVTRGGVYRTGDVAARDADGYITYVGRADDVFKAADYRISPFELESVAIEHEAVAEAAVVPSPDPLRLAVPKVFVALRQGYSPSAALAESILTFLRVKLAPYKRIRRLEFAELPKTISGKIRRVDLRHAEATRRAANEKGEWEFFEEDFAALRSPAETKSPRA
ncbi:AMP-binding protein [Rhodoferax sediminis]|jgi:acetyl-CoA synthetase|uniref:AMP-dependent synthetase n=1 Tax=Rhodoferax sediminis TaxID=2509614 RepID=A0A515D8G3_9BURK|nr:AMP-binding protein [Rhodoferax sediminis]QDL36657.1 AMP-dependent synthetase [Rhodoferax sediminis]